MSELTATIDRRPDRVEFTRSDGQKFFLLERPGGEVVLYRGEFTPEPPPYIGVANYDAATHDLVASAERRVLAWPGDPKDTE